MSQTFRFKDTKILRISLVSEGELRQSSIGILCVDVLATVLFQVVAGAVTAC